MPGIWPVGPAMHIPAETNELFSNPHGLPASAIFFFFFFFKDLDTLTWWFTIKLWKLYEMKRGNVMPAPSLPAVISHVPILS